MYADPTELTRLTKCSLEDAQLFIELASNAVDEYVGHSLKKGPESRVIRSEDSRTLWVVPAGWPLLELTVTVGDKELADGIDYRVRADGALRRLTASWWGEVEVSYTTGFDEYSTEWQTAKRIVLEIAARAMANPQLLDSINVAGANPSFVARDGQHVLPQFALSLLQRQALDPLRWRRRLA
ncbi:MAG: hypothetical protein HLX51_11725 [Micrococcaceae bacterium]|nr:hypothetical protein [Micrococcaceae bacterium]